MGLYASLVLSWCLLPSPKSIDFSSYVTKYGNVQMVLCVRSFHDSLKKYRATMEELQVIETYLLHGILESISPTMKCSLLLPDFNHAILLLCLVLFEYRYGRL